MSNVEFYEDTFTKIGALGGNVVVKEWRWRVKAGNGEIVASGEGYSTRGNAKRGFVDAFNAISEAYHSHVDEGGDWTGDDTGS